MDPTASMSALRNGPGIALLPNGNVLVAGGHGSGTDEYLASSEIFDPYFTTKKQGHGLGLALVYSVLLKHYGYITVDSRENVGTVFTIYLPAADSLKETAHSGTPVPGKYCGKILIMDDEEDVRRVLGRMLEYLGFEVDYAPDGNIAIEKYKKSWDGGMPFDCVVLDITVPGGVGGVKTIKKLQEINSSISSIVISGYSNDPILAHYREYGFCGVVTKPFNVDEIIEVLETLE